MKLIKKNSNKGFSLVELILVLGLSSLIFLGVLSMEKRRTETLKAEAAGQQVEEVGKALSSYIANQRAILSSSIPSNTTVTIPLTVLQGVTSGAYPGKQYLPLSFNPKNAFGTGYRLQIRNNGGDALTGIVITDAPVVDETGAVRYDWLGYAARVAGAQSGMSFFTGAQVTGLNAGWTVPSSQFSAINVAGQFAYRSQYQGNSDDIYLRRDGLYPMTGNLNMGNHNIRDATDINFNGFLNGNTALLNSIQSGYISNSGNIDNAGNITNSRDIRTLTVRGTGQPVPGSIPNSATIGGYSGLDYAAFSNIYATNGVNTSYINRYQTNGYTDVTIGNGTTTGLLRVRDIMLGQGGPSGLPNTGRNYTNRYLSNLLPRYSSRGIKSVTINGATPTYIDYPECGSPTVAADYKIEVIPQSVWVQAKVMGQLQLQSSGPDASGNSNLTIVQDQYAVGGFEVYAVDEWPVKRWRIILTNPRYNPSNAYVGGRVIAHLYCDTHI